MTLTLEQFILALVAGGFAMLALMMAVCWLLDRLARRRDRKVKLTCRLCGMRFYVQGKDRVIACPHCKALNERK